MPFLGREKMGYSHGKRRTTVECCHVLSVWGYLQRAQKVNRADAVDAIDFELDAARAVIEFTRDGRSYRQTLTLTTTPCHYGGARAWFVCSHCGRRVAKVYLPCNVYSNGARVCAWLCRHCWGLTYEQRRARRAGCGRMWVYQHRADRIRARYFERKGAHTRTIVKRYHQLQALDALAAANLQIPAWLLRGLDALESKTENE